MYRTTLQCKHVYSWDRPNLPGRRKSRDKHPAMGTTPNTTPTPTWTPQKDKRSDHDPQTNSSRPRRSRNLSVFAAPAVGHADLWDEATCRALGLVAIRNAYRKHLMFRNNPKQTVTGGWQNHQQGQLQCACAEVHLWPGWRMRFGKTNGGTNGCFSKNTSKVEGQHFIAAIWVFVALPCTPFWSKWVQSKKLRKEPSLTSKMKGQMWSSPHWARKYDRPLFEAPCGRVVQGWGMFEPWSFWKQSFSVGKSGKLMWWDDINRAGVVRKNASLSFCVACQSSSTDCFNDAVVVGCYLMLIYQSRTPNRRVREAADLFLTI